MWHKIESVVILIIIVLIIVLNFIVFHQTYVIKTLNQDRVIQQERNKELRKNLLSCGEAARQCEELLDGRTLILKLNKND